MITIKTIKLKNSNADIDTVPNTYNIHDDSNKRLVLTPNIHNDGTSTEPPHQETESFFVDLRIKAIPFQSGATASINFYGRDLETVQIYNKNSALNEKAAFLMEHSMIQTIKLLMIHDSFDKKAGEVLFEQNFTFQQSGKHIKNNIAKLNPQNIAKLPIYSFGGFYNPGSSIESIEQMFLQIIRTQNNKVKIYPSPQKSWEEKGCSITHGGFFKQNKIYFPEFNNKSQPRSLAENIRDGAIKIKLHKATNNVQKNISLHNNDIIEEKELISYDFKTISTNKIRVLFKEKNNTP